MLRTPILCLCLLSLAEPSQTQQGSVNGTVVGPDGTGVADASVTLREVTGGKTKELRAGEDGQFQFTSVAPGTYSIVGCGSGSEADALQNVGPSQIEPNAHPTVTLQLLPNAEDTSTSAIGIVAFTLFCGVLFFWFFYRIHPFALRVPITVWALWVALPIVLSNSQHALLALTARDAVWVGAYFAFVAMSIGQATSLIGHDPKARLGVAWMPELSERLEAFRSGALWGLPLVLLTIFVFAINSIRSGTREFGRDLVKGEVIAGLVWLVTIFISSWVMKCITTRKLVLRPSLPQATGTMPLILTAVLGFAPYLYLYRKVAVSLESGTQLSQGSPSIHLLLVLGELCLVLSVLTYFLDRWKIPLLTILIALLVVGTILHRGDHVFHLTGKSALRPEPSQAMAGRNRVIVVTAAGGGVQAAAWTARVLSGLAEQDPRIRPAIRLVSGVSGGSVGLMYFLNTYPSDMGGRNWSGKQAFEMASSPMLDAISWGLVTIDSSRLLGVQPGIDRGWVLDQALGARSGLSGVGLSHWSDGVSKGLPAVLLNATEVETGSPVAFSTTTFPNSGVVDIVDTLKRDVAVPTAVRISASFPVVSPVARPEGISLSGRPFPHLADGGYYDNYGMYSAMTWLEEAVKDLQDPPDVLFLRIEAFPADLGKTAREGWPFQAWAPLTTMMSVRTAAQQQRNRSQFSLLQAKYNRDGKHSISEITLRYEPPCGCPEPPLSWDLSPIEVDCLDRAYHSEPIYEEVNALKEFLNRP